MAIPHQFTSEGSSYQSYAELCGHNFKAEAFVFKGSWSWLYFINCIISVGVMYSTREHTDYGTENSTMAQIQCTVHHTDSYTDYITLYVWILYDFQRRSLGGQYSENKGRPGVHFMCTFF